MRALILCRVCLGKFYRVTDREPEAEDKVKSKEFDSVIGDRAASVGTYREFVIFDYEQVYPEYVVLKDSSLGLRWTFTLYGKLWELILPKPEFNLRQITSFTSVGEL